jgi:SAM-dependent methyltransferase
MAKPGTECGLTAERLFFLRFDRLDVDQLDGLPRDAADRHLQPKRSQLISRLNRSSKLFEWFVNLQHSARRDIPMDPSSHSRLTTKLLPLFAGDTLFDAIARAVCRAGCLPRKELFEAWEVARRVRRRFRGGRIVDLACGHGLLAQILLLLDDTSPNALAVDLRIPQSAAKLRDAILTGWPRLQDRIQFLETDIVELPLQADDLVVSVHACGGLTDMILDRAVEARARIAVLPCCHSLDDADLGGLEGWMDGPLAMDATRVFRLREKGYRVFTQRIPPEITPKNRLLLAEPA